MSTSITAGSGDVAILTIAVENVFRKLLRLLIGKISLKKLQEMIRAKTARLIAFNATTLAREAGNVLSVNMVLLGALTQTGVLPLTAEHVKAAMRRKTKAAFLDGNLKAFEMGVAAAQNS